MAKARRWSVSGARAVISGVLAIIAAFLALTISMAAERPGRKFTTVQRLERAHLQAVHDARLKWAEDRKHTPARVDPTARA